MPLASDQTDALRARLQARAAELQAEIDAVGEAIDSERALDEERDPLEGSSHQATREHMEFENAERARDRAELVNVRAALQRMDDGGYGLCIECGKEIDAARLQAQPAALRCIKCQQKLEQRNGGRS